MVCGGILHNLLVGEIWFNVSEWVVFLVKKCSSGVGGIYVSDVNYEENIGVVQGFVSAAVINTGYIIEIFINLHS